VQVRFERKALNVGVGPTLLLWFESNDSHRHCGWRFFFPCRFVNTKSQLRTQMRGARRALTPRDRRLAARSVANHVGATRWLAPGKRIGLYSPLPDELDATPLIALALARGCEVFLPRIVSLRARRMRFVAAGDARRLHRFGMHEPVGFDSLDARFLDTIFVPALAFDRRGARLGLGAGFYDRTLAFRRVRTHWRGPRLVGVAYSFQVLPQVPATDTDIHMDLIVTDRGIDELLAHENRTVDLRSR
jgi:5-formyltetrahydrofolate cyclo-ligase